MGTGNHSCSETSPAVGAVLEWWLCDSGLEEWMWSVEVAAWTGC